MTSDRKDGPVVKAPARNLGNHEKWRHSELLVTGEGAMVALAKLNTSKLHKGGAHIQGASRKSHSVKAWLNIS